MEESQRESFYDYYVREIEPNVVKYEFQRDKANRIFHIVVYIMAVILITGLFLFIINRDNFTNRYVNELVPLFIVVFTIPIVSVYSIFVEPVLKSIEKLLKINRSKNFSSITLSFEKNNINIMLEFNHSLFALSNDEKTYNYKQYEKIISDLQNIIKVVDDLELI